MGDPAHAFEPPVSLKTAGPRPQPAPAAEGISSLGNQRLQRFFGANAPEPMADEAAVAEFQGRYRALARILPREVVEGHASAAVDVPLSLLVHPGVTFADHDIWEAFLANRREHGSDAAGAELLRNEITRQYFAGRLSLHDPVHVSVTPPLSAGAPMSVELRLLGHEILTPDGTIGGADLLLFGPMDAFVARVQREASYVELTSALLEELESLEMAVNTVLVDVRLEPKDFSLSSVQHVQQRVHIAIGVVDDWSCRVGPALKPAADLMSRYQNVLSAAVDATNFMTWWHKENTMESAGQANARRGAATGDWYDIPVAAFWSVTEAVEVVGTLGAHNTRTEIATAYQAGDISWNEAEGLVNKATRRALITAAAIGTFGAAGARFGLGVAGGLGTTGTTAGVIGGVIGGGISSVGMLASQTVVTRFGGGKLSSTGQAIWDAGAPGGADWAVGVPLGMLTGGLFGGRSMVPRTSSVGPPFPRATSLFGRLAVWGRLRFGEPIMRGASEQNIDLMGEPTSIPGGSGPMSSRGPVPLPATGIGTTLQDPVFAPTSSSTAPSIQTTAPPVTEGAPAVAGAERLPWGYRPGAGERSVTRDQWRLFSSQVRQANALNRAFSEDAAFQTSDMDEINRLNRPRANVSVPFFADIGLNAAQESAGGRLFGKLWNTALVQAWQACDNALAQQRMAEVVRLWNVGTPQSRQDARNLARATFDNWVARFWRRVAGDPALRAMFTSAGLTIAAGRAPYYTWADGFEEGVTIEHWGSRLTDDPTRAVDANNLMFSMQRENVHMLEELRRQGW